MARSRKIHHDLHVPFEKLGDMSVADLLALKGPKFITYDSHRVGRQTLAVLISHNQWKIFNHRAPDVDFDKPMPFCVEGQTFLTIPCEVSAAGVLVAKESTGLKIVTVSKSRKKVKG